MQKLMLLSFLILNLACSKSQSPSLATVSESSPYELEMSALTATITESTTSYDESIIDFGMVQPKTKVSQQIVIKNTTSVVKPFSYVSNLTAPFTVKTTCSANIAPKRNCTLIISGLIVNEKSVDQGLYINGQELRVKVTTPEIIEPSVANIISSPASISLGIVNQNSQQSFQLTLTNQGTKSTEISIPAINNFSLISNSCGLSLTSKRSCVLKYQFNSAGKSGIVSESLIVGSASIAMSAEVSASAPVLSVINVTTSVANHVQTITSPAKFSKIITFTNNSSKPITNVSIVNQSPFIVSGSNCSGTIASKRACSLSINLDSQGLASNVYNNLLQLSFKEGLSAISTISLTVVGNNETPSYSFTSGFRQISDFNYNVETEKTECSLDIDGTFYPIKGNVSLVISDGTTTYGGSRCKGPRMTSDMFGNMIAEISGNAVLCVTLGRQALGIPLSVFNDILGGNCDNAPLSTAASRLVLMPLSYTDPDPVGITSAGDDVYFFTKVNFKQYLAKIKISNSDANGANLAMQPLLYEDRSIYDIKLIGNKLFARDFNENVLIVDQTLNVFNQAVLPCEPDCALDGSLSNIVKLSDNAYYFSFYSKSNADYKYLYKTTDGVSFTKIFEGIFQPSIYLETAVIHNNLIYFTVPINSVNVLVSINPANQSMQNTGIQADRMMKVNNSLYVVTSTSIKAFVGSNPVVDIVAEAQVLNIETVIANNNVMYTLISNGISGDLFSLDGSTNLSLVKANAVVESECDSSGPSTKMRGIINPITDSFIFECNGFLKKINYITKDISTVNSDGMYEVLLMRMSTYEFGGNNASYMAQEKQAVSYRNKYFICGRNGSSSSRFLMSFDSNDMLTKNLNGSSNANQCSEYVILHKDSLFFGSNDTEDRSVISEFGTEVYRYYLPN